MKPSCRRVLDRLRQGPATTHDLMQADVGGVRFGARLRELRELGFSIAEQRLPLPTRGSQYALVLDVELPQPSGERPTGVPGRRADPCEGVAAQPARDASASAHGQPDASLFDASVFGRGDWRDAA